MSLKVQSSFSAGELDPALHERTGFDKYQSGLATARNVVIGKTGRVMSRQGRKSLLRVLQNGLTCRTHNLGYLGCIMVFAASELKIYKVDGTLYQTVAHTYVEADLEKITFVDYAYGKIAVICKGKTTRSIDVAAGTIGSLMNASGTLAPVVTASAIGGTGYVVQYVASWVKDGFETSIGAPTVSTSYKLPITTATQNDLTLDNTSGLVTGVSEVRVYRRPIDGGAYGYIGSTSNIYTTGGKTTAFFTDFGQDADYSHTPPQINPDLTAINAFYYLNTFDTGIFYQSRLIMSIGDKLYAARPGIYTHNAQSWSRDFPLSDRSSLTFDTGADGYAKVLFQCERDGWIIFTSKGIYVQSGPMGVNNLAFDKRSDCVIDDRLAPLVLPSGVLFVDAKTNTVRLLRPSGDSGQTFSAEELSIFSNHLFEDKRIVSWCYAKGEPALVWCVFSDGTFAAFTHEYDQQMRAWTRGDSDHLVDSVCYVDDGFDIVSGARTEGGVYLITDAGEVHDHDKYLDKLVRRRPTAAEIEANPEARLGETIAAMDSFKSTIHILNGSLLGSDEFVFSPVTPSDWGGPLTLTCGTSGIFTTGTYGQIGTRFTVFDSTDESRILLQVTARASNNSVTVLPECIFPQYLGSADVNLYYNDNVVTGLTHLEGQYVAAIADGYVVASPNNSDPDVGLGLYQVSGGSVSLPVNGAIIHVGLPYAMDVETLDVDSVEQRPVLIESKTLNKLYVKVYRTQGLYIGNEFPDDDTNEGMFALDQIDVDYEDGDENGEEEGTIIGNRADQPRTKRIEATIPGDWKSQGRVCLRQVDPLHFEILSIIPDLEDMRR